jgi:hypothetical protein
MAGTSRTTFVTAACALAVGCLSTPDEMPTLANDAGLSPAEHISWHDLCGRCFADRPDGLHPPAARTSSSRRPENGYSASGPQSGAARVDRYRDPVSSPRVPGGVVHKLPADLRKALIANPTALDAWKDITPLARNEFICWVEDAKQERTRERRIRRTQEELDEGQRRPCCWPGCKHRARTGG